MALIDILERHASEIDSIAASFASDLQDVIGAASESVRIKLSTMLEVSGGVVLGSLNNRAILESTPDLLRKAMNENGYQEAVKRYTDSFNGQYVAFEEVLRHIDSELTFPLPMPEFNRIIKGELEGVKATQKLLLEDSIGKAVISARSTALTSIGALSPNDLAKAIAEKLNTSVAQAQVIADTGISTFYRSISERGFSIIEKDLPGFKVRYSYEGPLDKLNRPFCSKLQRKAKAGVTWTRKQIERMKNGQIANVFITCGGYRCRHQWIISTKNLNRQHKQRPATIRSNSVTPQRRTAARDKINLARVSARGRMKRGKE